MSSSLPPSGPSDPSPDPFGPTGGGPEVLEQGGGAPLTAAPAARNLKPVLIGGAAVAALAVAGGAAWAAMSFFTTGEQPAAALPAGTLAYVGIDLDPSGGQKIEALGMLNKFPAFKDRLGLDTDDDLRKALFDEIQGGEDACANLEYARDVESWLGDRAGVGLVDAEHTVVFVVQVSDADAAAAGLEKLRNCVAHGDANKVAAPDADLGYAIEGDWAVLAETTEIAERAAADGASSSLADDADFQTWTGRAGDPGVMTAYAAADAASTIFDSADGLLPMAGLDPTMEVGGGEATDQMKKAFADFQGMAATLRFSDGSLELETAGGFGLQNTTFYGTDRGDDALATLPADTVAAFGLGFQEGWLTKVSESVADLTGEAESLEEMYDAMEQELGIQVPEDVETLVGESAVLALGPGFDAESLTNSGDGSDIPVGVKLKGDPVAAQEVLDKLKEMAGPDAGFLEAQASGDFLAISPNDDYRAALLEDGGLGESETFQDVIREAEQAGVVFYLDFDGSDDWLVELTGDDAEAKANLSPLSAVGMSAWQEDGIAHAVLRVTTDE